MSEKILFRPHVGGLGDSVIYSTLPERWVREQGAEVYIVDPQFRNPGIAEIWKSNPFVSGILPDGNWNHIMSDTERLRRLCLKYKNNVMAAEAYFGFEPLNKHPKLYTQPKYDKTYSDVVFLDPYAVTVPFSKASFEPFVRHLCDWGLINFEQCIMLDSGQVGLREVIFHDMPKMVTHDIYEYVSMIYSCKAFVTISAGGGALASAIKGANPYPVVHAIAPQAILNKRIWRWANIDYFSTGLLSEDFTEH